MTRNALPGGRLLASLSFTSETLHIDISACHHACVDTAKPKRMGDDKGQAQDDDDIAGYISAQSAIEYPYDQDGQTKGEH